MPSLGDEDSIKPENGTVESFIKAKDTIYWNLTGSNRTGFYREKTASYFNPVTKKWTINKGFMRLDNATMPQGKPEVNLSGQLFIGSPTVTIPTRDGYLPSLNGFKTDTVGPVSFSRRADENYIVHFSNEDVGTVVDISFSLDKTNKSTLLPPTQKELQEMSQKIVDVSELYGYDYYSVREFVSRLDKQTELSKTEKAIKLEAYVKDELNYSLDPHYSSIYHKEKDNAGFINEIFKIGKVDCDVANTALVALLRSIDIPSRMAYGFANTGILDNDNRKLVGTEGHGWVEAYVDGKWISLDGTPTRMDEATQKALEKFGSQGGASGEEGDKNSQEGKGEGKEGEKKKEKEKDSGNKPEDYGLHPPDWDPIDPELLKFPKEAGLAGLLLSLEVLGAGAYGASKLLNRGSQKLAGRLKQDLEQRSQRYFGNNLNPSILEVETKRFESDFKRLPPGLSKFTMVLPYGIRNLLFEMHDADILARTSHVYPKGNQTTSETSQPDMYEFFTKVLGYGEKYTKRRLYNYAYQDTIIDYNYEYYPIASAIMEELNTNYSFMGKCDEVIVRKLFGIGKDLPQDKQDFNLKKTEVVSNLYTRYQRQRRKNLEQDRNASSPAVSFEDFRKSIERLIQFRVVERQIELAHKKALKSAPWTWREIATRKSWQK